MSYQVQYKDLGEDDGWINSGPEYDTYHTAIQEMLIEQQMHPWFEYQLVKFEARDDSFHVMAYLCKQENL